MNFDIWIKKTEQSLKAVREHLEVSVRDFKALRYGCYKKGDFKILFKIAILTQGAVGFNDLIHKDVLFELEKYKRDIERVFREDPLNAQFALIRELAREKEKKRDEEENFSS